MTAMAKRAGPEPRVATVADAMLSLGGGERVGEAFAEAFPIAPVYTLL